VTGMEPAGGGALIGREARKGREGGALMLGAPERNECRKAASATPTLIMILYTPVPGIGIEILK